MKHRGSVFRRLRSATLVSLTTEDCAHTVRKVRRPLFDLAKRFRNSHVQADEESQMLMSVSLLSSDKSDQL